MTKFEVTILGSMAALPDKGRLTSAQVVQFHNQYILIDCGEGTQINIARYGIPLSRITAIFISHLHGDHLFGLPGLLSSFQHHQRNKSLTIIGPSGLKIYLETIMQVSQQFISYPIRIVEIDVPQKEPVWQIQNLIVSAFPLDHRVPTFGYLFEEIIPFRNIRPEAITTYNLSIEDIKKVKKGGDLRLTDGQVVANEELTFPPPVCRSYVYCSDTSFSPALADNFMNVTVLYHEATYTHDLVEKARERKHSTSREAAMVAEKARAGKLLIGHFSSRYQDVNILLDEAKSVFPDTFLALEGERFEIK